MTPLGFVAAAFLSSVIAGLFGSLLGIGGGLIVVPTLTLLLGVDIRYAIGASIVSVIATSSGAAVSYVRDRLSNIRLAMLLEIATTAGALAGAFVAGQIGGRFLYVIFALVMVYTALSMVLLPRAPRGEGPADRVAEALRLNGEYFDEAAGQTVQYRVRRTRMGFMLSFAAGTISGLLGVGGGVMKVPAMNLAMGIPLKVASATSNFMIGVTAAASAGVYFSRGDINPFVTGPVAAGVLLGSTFGARLMNKLRSAHLRMLFVLLLGWVAVQMFLKAFDE